MMGDWPLPAHAYRPPGPEPTPSAPIARADARPKARAPDPDNAKITVNDLDDDEGEDAEPKHAATVLDIALMLAARGLAVFPCGASKRPAIPEADGGRGCLDATTDPDQVRALFARAPHAKLVGVACGPASGVDILDIDPRHGGDAWEQQNSDRLPNTLVHATPGGGRHHVFRHHPGVRNRQGAPASGVDVRGEGGYAVWPPSAGYEVVHDVGPTAWPQWLLGQVIIRTEPPPRPISRASTTAISNTRLDGLLRSLLARLSQAPEGQKHEVLLRIARTIGGYADLLGMSDDQLVALMLGALPDTVLDWRNAEKTARDGLGYGRAAPLGLEDRADQRGGTPGDPPRELQGPDPNPKPEAPPPTSGGKGFSDPDYDVLVEVGMLGRNFTLNELIDIFNRKFAVADDEGKPLVMWAVRDDELKREHYRRATFRDFMQLYQNRKFSLEIKDANGNTTIIEQSYARWWLNHERRRQYLGGVVFDPSGNAPSSKLNLWRSFAVEPKQGDWSLMRHHIRDVICGGRREAYDYLIRWLARMMQFPWLAAETAIVLRGPKGAGKGILGRWFLRLLGQHGLHIVNAEHLTGRFNGHLRDTIFVFADECFYAGDRKHESVLKALITEERLLIEAKYENPTLARNMLHILMASNVTWVVPASADERRYFVLDTIPDRVGDLAYFEAINQQMEAGGAAAMLYDLLHLDLAGFNHRDVPGTPELDEQKLHSLDSLHRWWLAVLDRGFVWKSRFGDAAFTAWDTFYTTELLARSYTQWCTENRVNYPATREALGRLMAKTYNPRRPRGEWPVYERDSIDRDENNPVVKLGNQHGWLVGSLHQARVAFAKTLNLPECELPWGEPAEECSGCS
jgi:hypothetical protein